MMNFPKLYFLEDVIWKCTVHEKISKTEQSKPGKIVQNQIENARKGLTFLNFLLTAPNCYFMILTVLCNKTLAERRQTES